MSKAWPKVRLGEVIREEREQVASYDGDGLPVLGVTNVEGVTHTGVEASDDKSKYLRLRPGRFVYNPYRINVGSIGLSSETQNGICSPAYVVFAPNDRIDASFLRFFLKSARGNQLINFHGNRGTVRSALRFDDLCQIEIPLPALAEQQRIVARIEELAAQIHEAHALREETAKVSEEIISKASARIFDSIKSVALPLGEVAEKKTGVAYKADDFVEAGDIPVVRLKEIGTKNPTVYLKNSGNYAHVWLEVGDIVLAKTSFSTGAMCQWPGPRAVLNQNAVMLRARKSVEQRFLYAWLGQQVFRYLSDHLADPNFYPYIREADLVQWLVPVPPLQEQRRIVTELDALQAEVDMLKRLQAESAAELDALLPAILDRAFKGEL